MAYKNVTQYYLTYEAQPKVWVRLEGEATLHLIKPETDADFVADMLRYEKPVYYDAVSHTLSTIAEEVGEQEL